MNESKTKKVTLFNDFHNTSVNVMVPKNGKLSFSQTKRVHRELCGQDECCCGVVFGDQIDRPSRKDGKYVHIRWEYDQKECDDILVVELLDQKDLVY